MKDCRLSDIKKICEKSKCESCLIAKFCHAEFVDVPRNWGIDTNENEDIEAVIQSKTYLIAYKCVNERILTKEIQAETNWKAIEIFRRNNCNSDIIAITEFEEQIKGEPK